MVALIPDLDDMRAAQENGWRVWLDYDHPRQTIRAAAGNYQVGSFHVEYQATPVPYAGQTVRVRLRVLTSDRAEDVRDPYGLIARYLWEHWGVAGYREGKVSALP